MIDPHTLTSQDYIMATWVQAETTALADALATCLFFSPPENFSPPAGGYKFEYLIMNKNREVSYSPNFAVELY
jgi:thiamine biosynthesis lipoprotein ApbE